MLVLSREEGQSIMVGEIEITVVAIKGQKVRIGVNAPKEVPVDRREIYLARKQEALKKTG